MRMSNRGRAFLGIAVGAAVTVGVVAGAGDVSAKPKAGGGIRVIDFDKKDLASVYQNDFLEITFSTDVDPASVNPAIFQVRERNATGTGFARQVAGSFQVVGSIVRFYPRLPTHMRDPASTTGDFYAAGSPRDDAEENAAFQPSTTYELRIIGGGSADTARSSRGRRLAKTYVARFSTTPKSPKSDAFTIDSYADAPPPAFQYSNPADKVASQADQYARHGGTREVPNAVNVTLFGNRVPLSPTALRKDGSITLTMTERNGDPTLTKPIRGTPFIEQNSDGVRMLYKAFYPLPDRGTFAMRVSKDVKDLTEQYDFRSNPERLRIREIYEFLVTAYDLAKVPGQPDPNPEDLPDPPIESIYDWPTDAESRGVLKRNLLALGTSYPYEVDPRVMVLFTTRDEPVSNGNVTLEFEQADGLYDPTISTANYDSAIPGTASAILTIAGGTGVDGDYNPPQSTTIDLDKEYSNHTINWRKVTIPPNVKITIKGSLPATVRCFEITMSDGSEIIADGLKGTDAAGTSYGAISTQWVGGKGGPGGGPGGSSSSGGPPDGYSIGIGGEGKPGVDASGTPMPVGEGGQGGKGGPFSVPTGNYVTNGGGGGGGGARLPGENGGASVNAPTNWYNSPGGVGGLGSANIDLNPFGGGAGGGAGGSGLWKASNWYVHGGGGGGGGGALLIQTAGTFTIGVNAAVRARGGGGGKGVSPYYQYFESAPGGGGGGGTLLLRTTKDFNFANPATSVDVKGGARGTATPTYGASYGGAGGVGYITFEDTTGGTTMSQQVSGSSGGTFDPVGGGAPSVVYTKWIEVGVDGPRFLNPTQSDFVLSAGGNDAILLEIQMAIEDGANFGKPLLTAVNPITQDSTNTSQVSAWTPVRIVDLTGRAGGAFGPLPNYNLGQNGTDYIFPIADQLNGFNFRFLRVRLRFQLDNSQSIHEPFPFVDRMVVNFQFNL